MASELSDWHGMERLPPTKAVVLMAVLRQDRPTVRSVQEATGHASTNTVHAHLRWLREAGLVEWDEGRAGTLRSTLTVVAMDRSLLPSDGTTPRPSRTPAA